MQASITSFSKAALSLMVLAAAPAWAVNKCTGPDGKVSFQDAPCAAGKAERMAVTSQPLIDAKAAAAAAAATQPKSATAAAGPALSPVAQAPTPAVQPPLPAQATRSPLEQEADICLNWYRPALRDPAGAYFTTPSKEGRVLKMMIHATNGYGGYVKQEGVCELKYGSIDEDWTKIHAKRAGWSTR